jgi:hypothetical protein
MLVHFSGLIYVHTRWRSMYHQNNYLAHRLKNNTNECIITVSISINFQLGVHYVITNELVGRESATPMKPRGKAGKQLITLLQLGKSRMAKYFPGIVNAEEDTFVYNVDMTKIVGKRPA